MTDHLCASVFSSIKVGLLQGRVIVSIKLVNIYKALKIAPGIYINSVLIQCESYSHKVSRQIAKKLLLLSVIIIEEWT